MLAQLLLALALGFKHSYDADHLVAVSTLLTRSRSLGDSLRLGASWAAGHMLTAGIITSILFVFRETLLSSFLSVFETIVAAMLIILGVWALRDVWRLHTHAHAHPGGPRHIHVHEHDQQTDRRVAGRRQPPASEAFRAQATKSEHRKIFSIGIIQGLASNDELLLLLAALFVAPDFGLMLLGVAVFSIGVVLGMTLFSSLLGAVGARGSERVRKLVVLGSSLLSIGYGLALLAGIA